MSDAATHTNDTLPAPGRPVRLTPVAPGFWMTTLGACLAGLAPLLGFLLGVMAERPEDPAALNPLYVGLLGGVVIGGIGVVVALLGGVRLWRHHHRKE